MIKHCFNYKNLIIFLMATPNAFAQTAASSGGPAPNQTTSFLMQLPLFVGIFFIFYIALIRPQRQQQKKQTAFLAALTKGQDVVTSSGMIGTIVGIADRVVTLEVSEGTEVKILKSHVQGLLKETLNPVAKT